MRSLILNIEELATVFDNGAKLEDWGIPGFDTIGVDCGVNYVTFHMSREIEARDDGNDLGFLSARGIICSRLTSDRVMVSGDKLIIKYTLAIRYDDGVVTMHTTVI